MDSDKVIGARCQRCGGEMKSGFGTALRVLSPALSQPRLAFVVRGEPTSLNPLKAFQQGVDQSPQDEAYLLEGRRCIDCGAVELTANEKTAWP